MWLLSIVNFIRFRILYISSKYRWLERKITGKDQETHFEVLVGMVSNELRNYCFKYGKEKYTGTGALVDLGSWLGSSVIPLASGLKQNLQGSAALIHAYDAFVWYENMTISAKDTKLKNKYNVGDSFLYEFKYQTNEYQSRIVVHQGNLKDVVWEGGLIEYLMIDAMKDWEVALKIVNVFYPKLIQGKSVVIHEDFSHHYTSWIHLIHYRMREYFEPINDIPNSSEVIFLYKKTLPPIQEIIPERFDSFSVDEIAAAFNYSLSLVSKSYRPAVLASKAMAYRHIGNYQMALKTLNEISFITKYLDREVYDANKQINRELK